MKSIKDEIKDYSIDDLELIISTQQNLYTNDEMEIIRQHCNKLKEKYIQDHIPKEVICPKCDAVNSFNNDKCDYCGHIINKDEYYKYQTYSNQNDEIDDENVDNSGTQSFLFQYIISLVIPFIGIIIGAIMTTSNEPRKRSAGKICFTIGLISLFVNIIITKSLN